MSRELDEQCAQALGHKIIEWRVCASDPESGQWEELQDWAAAGGKGEGDIIWTRPAVRHPCYNWLDTEEPRQQGWTNENIAATPRGHHWQIVPFYSSDHAASRLLEDEIERRGLEESYITELCALIKDSPALMINHAMWLVLRATPEQRAHAFLTATQEALI